jgi:hypothetical protein
MVHRVELELAGRTLSIETGKVAKQADAAVWVQYGETIILDPYGCICLLSNFPRFDGKGPSRQFKFNPMYHNTVFSPYYVPHMYNENGPENFSRSIFISV